MYISLNAADSADALKKRDGEDNCKLKQRRLRERGEILKTNQPKKTKNEKEE